MNELYIVTEGGQLIFSWHAKDLEGEKKDDDDDLIGGFLTAINMFATEERGEDIKSLKLKQTTLIFEKYQKLLQKLNFIATTRDDDLIELTHAILHDIIIEFTETYKDILEKEFTGEITAFKPFEKKIDKLYYAYGFSDLRNAINNINNNTSLKSVILIEPKGGNILYIYAKQYVNKEKISFLVPLIVNSSSLLYTNNLDENIHWILLNTVKNENLLVELRDKILLIKQYQLDNKNEEQILNLDFFKEKEKYVRFLQRERKIIKQFQELIWDPKIKQIYLVDLLGKILFSKIIDETYDCRDYIPETISFLTSSKKACEQIYHRILFNASIGGTNKFTTICINFNNFALTLIGDIKELNDFQTIQKICEDLLLQLI